MDVDSLRDDQWERILAFIPDGRIGKRRPRSDNRRFINALLWLPRGGGICRSISAPINLVRLTRLFFSGRAGLQKNR